MTARPRGQKPPPAREAAGPTSTSGGHSASGRAHPPPGGLDGAAETIAGLTAAALAGGLDGTTALASLTAARRLAAELERGDLALIEAARGGGATWGQVAGARDRPRRSRERRA